MRSTRSSLEMAVWAGVLLCAAPLAAQIQQPETQAPVIYTAEQEAEKANTLFDEMNADAQQIDSHAMELAQLAEDPDTPWVRFDQEWTDIMPAQEMLETHMWGLDEMRASLSDAQRRALDQTKRAATAISARTHGLHKLIGRPGAYLNLPRLRSDAQSLAEDAETVAYVSANGA
jgi:hypothetical protein